MSFIPHRFGRIPKLVLEKSGGRILHFPCGYATKVALCKATYFVEPRQEHARNCSDCRKLRVADEQHIFVLI